ncbi:dihydroneopterin aldolase [Rubritalea marina]|uniref:dihydroneopterin aldolase n=1 Tax=Rubritalea marina TaxID=361055 RepID=UPI0003818D3F|nr:dihydroneopterin aldolase [Rubritalea marina]
MKDTIIVKGLRVPLYLGVPDEERAQQQVIHLNLEMIPARGFSELDEDIDQALNYYEVSQRVKAVAADKPRKLIETLAEEVCATLLEEFEIQQITLEIEKFIMPDTEFVGLRIQRSN